MASLNSSRPCQLSGVSVSDEQPPPATNPTTYRLPIGSENDMIALLKVLYECERAGQNPAAAMTILDGVHGHTVTEWRDFFLTNVSSIFSTHLSRTGGAEPDGAKTVDVHIRQPASALCISPQELSSSDSNGKHASNNPAAALSDVASSSTPYASSGFNAQTAPDEFQLSPHSHTTPPKTASSSISGVQHHHAGTQAHAVDDPDAEPTPPTKTVPFGRGCRFSDEDQAYFYASLRWALMRKPQTRVYEVCNRVAQKAVHHSIHSWRNYAEKHTLEIERVKEEVAAARGKAKKTRQRLSTQTSTPTDGIAGMNLSGECVPSTSVGSQASSRSTGSVVVKVEDSNSLDEQADLALMGPYHSSYTAGDERMMARYIASKGDAWYDSDEYPTQTDRWYEFHEMHPQRSAKSWCGHYTYSTSRKKIDALAAMFRRQAARKNMNGEATRRCASKRASAVEVIDLTSPSPPPEIRSGVQEVTEI